MEMDQQPLYQHLLSPDYHSTLLSPTSPLLTGCIGATIQDKKSDDTNKSAEVHAIYLKPPPESTREATKQVTQDESNWNQWFDNEFAGIYREYHQQQEKQEKQKSTKKKVSASQPSPAINHDHHTIQSVSASSTSTFNDIDSLHDKPNVATQQPSHVQQVQQHLQPFPWPESVDQIYGWCRIANKSKDSKSQVKLCRRLLATLAHYGAHPNQEQTNHTSASSHSLPFSMLSLPSLSSSSTSTSLSSSSTTLVDHDHIRHVMMKECLCILKRQSMGQGLGKGGDSEAQFILANCYGIGLLGLPEDHSKAFQLFMQASKQSHPEATYRTAVCYELGIGTRKDGQRAMIFYRKSAHLSHAGSMYKLGMILLRGYYHTTPLPREAISWFQRAASHVTTTTTENPTIACLSRATSLSSLPSTLNFTNDKSSQVSNSSKSIIASTSSQIHHQQAPHAIHALAMIQMREEMSNTTSLIADPAYAIELLHQAAKRDHVPSQLQLGHCFEHGQWVPTNEALSIYWYARASQLESPEGCLAISGWYLTGTSNKHVLPPSDREAYLWAHRAIALSAASPLPVDQGTMAKAHFAVAVLLERGRHGQSLSGKEATKKARSWMLRAASLGHQGASKWLKMNQQDAEQTNI